MGLPYMPIISGGFGGQAYMAVPWSVWGTLFVTQLETT